MHANKLFNIIINIFIIQIYCYSGLYCWLVEKNKRLLLKLIILYIYLVK